jgi:G3E family GTPase
VIINEIGEIGIDHLLVSTPSENMRKITDGCLCCVMQGELIETLAEAMRQRREGTIPPFEHVLIETTGLADPVPIVRTVVTHPALSNLYYLDTVIGMVDGLNGSNQLDASRESVKQAAIADLLLISKTDLAWAEEIAALKTRLNTINRTAEVHDVERGKIDPRLLFGRGWLDSGVKTIGIDRRRAPGQAARQPNRDRDKRDKREANRRQRKSRHTNGVQTYTVLYDTPATRQGLRIWLHSLACTAGPSLLRVKGLVNVEGRPFLIQAVQSVVHEPVELDAWPNPDQRTRLIFIVRGVPRKMLERPLAFLSMPGIAEGQPREAASYAKQIAAPQSVVPTAQQMPHRDVHLREKRTMSAAGDQPAARHQKGRS